MQEFSQIWIVSFGAKWIQGEGWTPSFLTARELRSRQTVSLDQSGVLARRLPPYPTVNTAVLVAFIGEAIGGCHIRLGWPPPTRLIDLRGEFRNLANGQRKPCGDGLIGALIWFGMSAASVVPDPTSIHNGVVEVAALERLYLKIQPYLDPQRAFLRGRYLLAAARIEANGIPLNLEGIETLKRHWRNVVRQVGGAISDAKPSALAIGLDGRHRAPLRPFASRTGRNQPSRAEFLLAAPGWLRRLIKPSVGRGLAIIDWQQHEFGIASALSGDERMMADYQSGDPYLALADRYGSVDAPSARSSRRDAFKTCSLGVLNGISPSGLARQIGCGVTEARLLLHENRVEYPRFWRWSDSVEMEAYLHGRLQSVFGWGVAVNAASNPRFLRNFPVQSNGAEMLRLACCLATENGVMVCAPNHDALLIEAPLEELADTIDSTEAAMAEASEIVLDGFPLRTSVTTVRYPDHYPHPRSDALWSEINRALAELEESSEPARKRDACCARMHPRPISSYVLNRKDRSDAHD
jgi:hypothetical protein